MTMSNKHIIIIAGEASGDLHAAHLVNELKKIDPTLTFSGLGGSKMQDSGVKIYHDLTKIAVVGFWEVLKHYSEIKKAFLLILEKIDEVKPACVVLVDYPGFNLRLAKKLKQRNIKVVYYISPQVWAWKENRVHQIKKNIDKMLVLFPFEKKFYARYGMEVTCVGHPLLDAIVINTPKEEFLDDINMAHYKLTIGLLPGSRPKEVEEHLPIMLETAEILNQAFPMIQYLIIKAPSIDGALIERLTPKLPSFPLRIIYQNNYDAMNACNLCIVTSGTATLETAILQKPMVVIYKTSLLTWTLAKLFVKIPNIGLVNVVAGTKIVPECIQFQATPHNIAHELENIFTDEIKIADIKAELRTVKEILGSIGASRRAAEEIVKVITETSLGS